MSLKGKLKPGDPWEKKKLEGSILSGTIQGDKKEWDYFLTKSKILEESTLHPALFIGCCFSSLLLPRYAVATLQIQSLYLWRHKNNGTHTSREKVEGRNNSKSLKKHCLVAGLSYNDNPFSRESLVMRIVAVLSKSKQDFQTSKMSALFFIIKVFLWFFCSSLSVFFKNTTVLLFSTYSGKTTMDWPFFSKIFHCAICENSENHIQQSEASGWNRCCRKL